MPKIPRISAREAESMLLAAGFILERSKGSHRIFRKGNRRVILPFHAGKDLHPKIIAQVIRAANT